jgi:hypothetical protein
MRIGKQVVITCVSCAPRCLVFALRVSRLEFWDRVSSLDEDTKSCDLSVLKDGISCDMSPLAEVCLKY